MADTERELEEWWRRLKRPEYAFQFVDAKGRQPLEGELDQFISEQRNLQAMRCCAAQAKAREMDELVIKRYAEINGKLSHEEPTFEVALRKLRFTHGSLVPILKKRPWEWGLPKGQHDLSCYGEQAFAARFPKEVKTILTQEETRWWLFPIPTAEYEDKGLPVLAVIVNLYGVLYMGIGKKPSFQREFDGYFFNFEYKQEKLGYLWHAVSLKELEAGPIVPLFLLDGISRGQQEPQGSVLVRRYAY